jgi:hypothetical protein
MYPYQLTACLLLGLTFLGCGSDAPETYPASGKVVYPDGTPLAEGTIYFK